MKRLISAVSAALILLILTACVRDSFGFRYYETFDRMDAALDFDMRQMPGLDDAIGYGAQDKKLGEIRYAVETEDKESAVLFFRMADTYYAKKFTEHAGSTGIAGHASEEPVKTERLGSSDVSYYVDGDVIYAEWLFDGYAFSAALTFDNGGDAPEYDDIYPFVLSFIASK